MGGICGVVDFGSGVVSETAFSSMLGRLSHRGPDGSHAYFRPQDGIGLGEVRLNAFMPEPSSSKASLIETADAVAAIDGGVTNRPEVLSRLPNMPAPAAAVSDRDVVALAYQAYGADCPRELNGPVALAIWDKRKKTVLLARDKLGERSLYYYVDPRAKRLVFASEIKAILAEGSVRRELDLESLPIYLAFGFLPGSRTLFKNIRRLSPGERLWFDASSGATRSTYWRLPRIVDGEMDEAYCIEHLKDLFLTVLERYVGGAQEVAVFLSGGMDSSIIVAGLREIGVPRIGTFSVGFEIPSRKHLAEDLEYARLVAERFGTEHHEAVFRPGHEPLPGLLRVVRQLDDLIMTPNMWSRDSLAHAMRRAGFNAALTGLVFTEGLHGPKKRAKLLQKTQDCQTDQERIFRWRNRLFDWPTQERLLKTAPEISKGEIHEEIRELTQYVEGGNFLRRYPFYSLRFKFSAKSLRELEEIGALSVTEVRSPYFDPTIAEFATQLPESFDGGNTYVSLKTILKKAFAAVLPEAVLERPVIGFPSYYWNNGELAELQHRLLGRAALERMGLFDYDAVQEILAEDRRSEKKSAGKRSWALTQFALWYEDRFMGGPEDTTSGSEFAPP